MSDDGFDTVERDDDPEVMLASAYLDGEATDDERALVETSATALDEVRRLGDVRTVLDGTAPQASLSERENHLAAALDVWERMSDVERSGEATPIAGIADSSASRRSARRRRERKRSGDGFGASQWFLSAAAVLVVVAGGAAVVRGILAETDDVDPVAFETEDSDAPAGVEDIDSMLEAEVNDENVGSDGLLPQEQIEGQVASSGDSAGTGLFEADSGDDDVAAADSATEESADEALPDDAVQPSPPAEDEDLPVLTSRSELSEFGGLVIPALEASPIVTSDIDFEPPPDSCEAALGVEQIAGLAIYQDQTVTVGVDLDRDLVLAYIDDAADLAECEIVDRATLTVPDTATSGDS